MPLGKFPCLLFYWNPSSSCLLSSSSSSSPSPCCHLFIFGLILEFLLSCFRCPWGNTLVHLFLLHQRQVHTSKIQGRTRKKEREERETFQQPILCFYLIDKYLVASRIHKLWPPNGLGVVQVILLWTTDILGVLHSTKLSTTVNIRLRNNIGSAKFMRGKILVFLYSGSSIVGVDIEIDQYLQDTSTYQKREPVYYIIMLQHQYFPFLILEGARHKNCIQNRLLL